MSLFRRTKRVLVLATVTAAVATAFGAIHVDAKNPRAPVDGIDQAYHGQRVTKSRKGVPPNKPVSYSGRKLSVRAVKVGREAAEPTIGVTKDGAAFYAAGTFDALKENSPLARTEVYRSTDGGIKWKSVTPVLPGPAKGEPPTTLDPYVYVDEATGRVFNPELYAGCTYLLYSDDNAKTWQRNPAACGDFVNDHQTFVAGPPPAALALPTIGYKNVLYYCFNRVADSSCGRSLDGGVTWHPTAEPAFFGFDATAGGLCGGLHGHIMTDSKGRLFLPKGHCGYPWIAISNDGGDTWQRVQVSDKVTSAGTHLSVAVDADDNVYMLWWDRDREAGTASGRLPYLSVSKNHGKTWSAPLMIAPPGVDEVNFPVMTAGDTGRIAITFPGTTVAKRSDATRPWNQYVVVSTNALSQNPLFVSTTANEPSDPVHRGNCGPGRCGGMFDFLDILVSPRDGDIWATMSDTCVDVCAKGAGGGKQVGDGIAIRQLGGPSMWGPGHKRR